MTLDLAPYFEMLREHYTPRMVESFANAPSLSALIPRRSPVTTTALGKVPIPHRNRSTGTVKHTWLQLVEHPTVPRQLLMTLLGFMRAEPWALSHRVVDPRADQILVYARPPNGEDEEIGHMECPNTAHGVIGMICGSNPRVEWLSALEDGGWRSLASHLREGADGNLEYVTPHGAIKITSDANVPPTEVRVVAGASPPPGMRFDYARAAWVPVAAPPADHRPAFRCLAMIGHAFIVWYWTEGRDTRGHDDGPYGHRIGNARSALAAAKLGRYRDLTGVDVPELCDGYDAARRARLRELSAAADDRRRRQVVCQGDHPLDLDL